MGPNAKPRSSCSRSGGRQHGAVGSDLAYNVPHFVAAVRQLGLSPHVAVKAQYNANDGRITRTAGYRISQRKRKLVEQVFGWTTTIGCCASCGIAGAGW
jgi:hypothetical protein